MPNGNSLGPRIWVKYIADSGANYAIQMDASIAASVEADFPASGTPNLPRRFKPRRLHLKSASGLHKSVVVPSSSFDAYLSGGNVTIDGVVFTATGRSGESHTFPNY